MTIHTDNKETLQNALKRIEELDMKRKAERQIFQGIVEKKNEQLTKAKEILEELAKMEYAINPPADKVKSLMVKAEQFLKEIEK